MVDSVNDTTMTLSWMEPNPTNGVITTYQVQYRRCSATSLYSSRNVNTLTHTVTGLDVYAEYCFRVRAFTRVGGNSLAAPTIVMAGTCE